MKKKTVSGLTALTMLTSATFPVYAAPIEEGVTAKGLSNPPSTAQAAKDPMNVYTSFTKDNDNNSGNGSANSPYNRFEDAIANVQDGGTIYIDSEAFLNDVGGNLPFLIDKNVTIKPINGANNASLSVRSAGILLGANVKFENITLDFANRYHDSIFANGYTLDLINVTHTTGTREIDLFAGGLYELTGNQIHPSGNKGVINVETNGNFGGGELMSTFGNIYAGSMNGKFEGTAEINVARKDNSKKLTIGAIKASGALESYVSDNFFDGAEPLPPKENPELFPMNGNVSINLDEYKADVDGLTGSNAKTKVTASFEYLTGLNLKDVHHLEVASGKVKVNNMNTIPHVTMGEGATLDLTNLTEVTMDNYDGNGIVVLNKNGKLNITNPMKGSMVFQADGSNFYGESERVTENHVYITTPNEDADISFTPHNTQEYLDLVWVKNGSIVEWTTKEADEEDSTESTEPLGITGFVFEDGQDSQTKTSDEINSEGYGYTKFPFKITTDRELTADDYVYLEDYGFDITVNGEKAVYREDENDYFVSELGLSLYFFSEYNDYDHELVVTGSKINVGEYAINVSHNGKSFDANLTVTGDKEETPKEDEEVEEEEPSRVFDVLYLSDIKGVGGYRPHMSYAYNGSILMDKNHASNFININVDGEPREFTKGFSTQGNSEIVFDTRFENKKFTRVVGKIGIDASQASVGNGADVTILKSSNGQQWEVVQNVGTVTGAGNAVDVDLNIPNGTILKFKVSDKGDSTGDCVVFADFKLVEADYVEEVKDTKVEGLKRVEEYDAILSSHTPEYNLEHNKMTILQRAFVNKLGYQNVKVIANTSKEYAEAINYLMNDETALNYLITGGDATKEGSYSRSIRYFCDIYSKYAKELKNPADNYFNLRLAISTSLAFANPVLVTFWNGTKQDVNAVRRYEQYQKLVADGYMDRGGQSKGFEKWSTQQFKDLPIPLMRWTVGNRINDDEIFWLADYALSEKEKSTKYLDAYHYISYLDYDYDDPRLYNEANKQAFNEKHGNFLNYFNDYGKKGVYRLWMVFEEGAVCGGLSKTYANLAQTFGRPSSVMGQPGHAAAMTWGWNATNQRYEWAIQNDIYGWAQSGNEYNDRMLNWGNKSWTIWHGASYNVLATDAVLDGNYEEVTILNLLANSYNGNEDKKAVYLEALETQSINLDSMEGLINAYKADETTTSADYLELAKRIINNYTYYPQAMMELLALIEGEITNDDELVQLDILKNNALLAASKATPKESTNVTMTKQLASKYLEGEDFGEVATFSFDGENAGNIVLNSKYGNSQIMLEYSLDGGNTWTQTDKKVIELSKDELESITAENDIKVSLVGVDTMHTIDILEGETITASKIIKNDYENLLLGNVANLEFSLDGGNEWCDYVVDGDNGINSNNVSGIRFNGNQTVKVRYKANGTRLQSAEVEYKFTENADTDTRKYVQLKNIKYVKSSAHQGGHNPEYMLDGGFEKGFHTPYNAFTQDKFYVVEFDQPRYISAMEYLFAGGNNGRLKSGTIQASLDGETWTTIKTFSNMPRDVQIQAYEMDTVIKAKYIKIVADETHGNGGGEANKFFAGKELRFFEDTTIVEDTPTPLPDDVPMDSDDVPTILPDDVPIIENPENDGGNDNAGNVLPPVVEDTPSDEVKPTPPTNEDGSNKGEEVKPTPPTNEDGSNKGEEVKPTPPTNEDGSNKGEEVKPTPPTNEDGSNKGEEVTPTPPTNEDGSDKEEVMPVPPTNGIEGLDKLDKELQGKVDSILADTVIDNKGLTLNITGDNSDIKQVTTLEVTKDGIFAVVDGEKLKFGAALDGLELDLTNTRVVRINPERNSIGSFSAVPYRATKDGLKIYSSNMENLLITTKVSEPFEDVNDTDWFKADVEEIYNNGFTQGTTATTYSPNNEITRGEFVSLLARALELQTSSKTTKFEDINGKWYQNEAQALAELGIIKGNTDGTFGGDNNITRQEAATLITRMLAHLNVDVTADNKVVFDDMDDMSAFAKDSIQYLVSKGVLVGVGDSKFKPINNLTRAEMAKILVRSLKLTDLY